MPRKGVLRIEIADTPSKQQYGLMHRKQLDNDCGMLFKFNQPDILKFWGMNTYIPLDIAFIDSDNKIVNIDKILPFSLKTIASSSNCVMAIEANSDYFATNKIKAGDYARIRQNEDGDIVIFGLSPDEDDVNVTLRDLFS